VADIAPASVESDAGPERLRWDSYSSFPQSGDAGYTEKIRVSCDSVGFRLR